MALRNNISLRHQQWSPAQCAGSYSYALVINTGGKRNEDLFDHRQTRRKHQWV
ncbi:MAG: hypothetical protein JSS76_13470 [Bacteroidetes bacterium]|nr:hypothetical protein [Bacteroidota bacterium]